MNKNIKFSYLGVHWESLSGQCDTALTRHRQGLFPASFLLQGCQISAILRISASVDIHWLTFANIIYTIYITHCSNWLTRIPFFYNLRCCSNKKRFCVGDNIVTTKVVKNLTSGITRDSLSVLILWWENPLYRGNSLLAPMSRPDFHHHGLISHSVTLFWYWASHSLPYPVNGKHETRKRQVSIL